MLFVNVLVMVFGPQNKVIKVMKNINLRNFMQKKFNRTCPGPLDHSSSLYDVLDLKLRDVNTSFTHNFHLIDTLLDITKTKRTLRSNDIKQFYRLFTENKAESLIFVKVLSRQSSDPVEPYLQNRETLVHLKRLYCRMIQKMMVKISYFLMNRRTLGFLYPQALELIKRCEILTRRVDFMRDTSNINQVVASIYAQNEELMQRIIEELIDRGFIISSDEFYRINGFDLDHREYFQRNQSTIQEDDQEPLESKQKEPRKRSSKLPPTAFEIDLKREMPKRLIKRSQSRSIDLKRIENPPQIQRTGWTEVQDKYRDLLISLEQMISHQTEEIKEENEENEPEEEGSPTPSADNELMQSQVTEELQQEEVSNENSCYQLKGSALLYRDSPLKHLRKPKHKPTYMSSPLWKVDLNKDFASEKDKQQDQNCSQTSKTEHFRRQISNQSANSLTQVITHRKTRASGTFPFFSKEFAKAIASMEKMNLRDTSNRLGLKRMSEQLLIFHKGEEEGQKKPIKNAFIIKNSINRKGGRNSIIKLLNIYKNKREGERIASVKRSVSNSRCSSIASPHNSKSPPQKQPMKASIFRPRPSLVDPALQDLSLPSISIHEKKKEILERYLRHNASQQWFTSQMQQVLLDSGSDNPQLGITLGRADYSLPRFTASPLSSVLQISYRGSPRHTHEPSGLGENEVKAVRECLRYGRGGPVEGDSIFTNKGINRLERVSFKGRPVISHGTSPRGSPGASPKAKQREEECSRRRVQVFDRLRRVILR